MTDLLSLNTCVVCGEPILYRNTPETAICSVCGVQFDCEGSCANGHSVCKSCYDNKAINIIKTTCLGSESKNPYDIASAIMKNSAVRMHDVKHHILVGASLLTAYNNAGGDIDDISAALDEMEKRGKQVPPGACGYFGSCGAAVSCGAFYSIISKSTPYSETQWGLVNTLTGTCLIEIGKIGGPRCCKRDSFIALNTAIDFVDSNLGIQMQKPDKLVCDFSERNKECIKEKCPYYNKEQLENHD